MSDHGVPGYGDTRSLSTMSHGEGLLEVFAARFNKPGLYLFDEPESGLSFQAQLSLCYLFKTIAKSGGQVICATHSPILCATRPSNIVLFNELGLAATLWENLELTQMWRRFMIDPSVFLEELD